MTQVTELISIAELRFGHDPAAGENINARITRREEGLEELKASIVAHGLIVPLIAVDRDGELYVIEGNRRLAALKALDGAGPTTVPVVIIDAPDGDALEKSLVANIMHRPLHPVDQYEAFSLIKKPVEEIARDFGLAKIDVERALALGRLSEKVREAWRAGTIKAEAAQCFTLAPDPAVQDKTLAALLKQGHGVQAWQVRGALKAEGGDGARFVNFVGVEEYEKQGGTLVRDLFDEKHIVLDPDLAKQLAGKKIDEVCADLIDNGWSWASSAENLPREAEWNWETINHKPKPTEAEAKEIKRLKAVMLKAVIEADETDDGQAEKAERMLEMIETEIAQRTFTDKDKKRSGCIVSIGHDGELGVKNGVIRPAGAKGVKADAAGEASNGKGVDAKAEKKPAEVSGALITRLGEQLTKAAAECMKTAEPKVVRAALIAGFTSYAEAVHVQYGQLAGTTRYGEDGAMKEFPAALRAAVKADEAAQRKALAHITAAALALRAGEGEKGAIELCNILNPKDFVAALTRIFDAEDYFKSVTAELVKKALTEMKQAVAFKGVVGKAALVKIAVREAKKFGWLPRELRTAHYKGQGTKK